MEIALGPGLSFDGLFDITTTATSDPALSDIRYISSCIADISSLGRGTMGGKVFAFDFVIHF